MVSMVGAGWKETSRDRRGKAYEKDGKASVQTRRKYSSRCAFHLGYARLERLFPQELFPGQGSPPPLSLSSLPPRKNEINATLWHRTKGKGLSVNLTTLRFRLQNSFRRMENERSDTKGPPTVRQDPVLGMRLIVTYFTSAQIASLGIVVRWIVMDPLDQTLVDGMDRAFAFRYNDLFVKKREREIEGEMDLEI